MCTSQTPLLIRPYRHMLLCILMCFMHAHPNGTDGIAVPLMIGLFHMRMYECASGVVKRGDM